MPLRSRRQRQRKRRAKAPLVAAGPPPPRLVGEGRKARGGVLEYDSFRIGEEVFSCGDCACLQNPDADSDPFVCRIERIYQPAAKRSEPQVTVRWFYRPADTALRPSELKGCAEDELFESHSLDDNELTAVDDKCKVLPWSQRRQDREAAAKAAGKKRKGGNKEGDGLVFYCRYMYDTSKCLLRPCLEDEAAFDFPSEVESDGTYSSESEGEGEEFSAKHNRTGSRPRRPSSSRKPKTKASPKGAPKAARRGANLTLPTAAAAATDPSTPLGAARRKLHVSTVPDALPCREVEHFEIYSFVAEKVRAGASGCMFVSGVPGTGKTATVRAVAAQLRREKDNGALPRFQFVELNAMSLPTPQHAYSELWREVSEREDATATPAHAAELLDKRFTTPSPRRQCAVVLLDEIDQLWTRKQEVMYNLFDWPTHKHARLILVAVANTMDLPERVLAHRVSSRLGLTRLTFAPYTRQQLVEILKARVEGSRAISGDALQLCARKVAAVSGDARRALDICRRATEIAETFGAGSCAVDISHVNDALQEMSASPMIAAMRSAPLHAQLFLIATVSRFRVTGLEEAAFGDIAQTHLAYCVPRGISSPSISELAGVCSRLGACHLLLVEAGEADVYQRVRLNCSMDDVLFALRDDPTAKSLSREMGT